MAEETSKEGPSKASRIRELVYADPTAKATQVAERLTAKHGAKCVPQEVTKIVNKLKEAICGDIPTNNGKFSRSGAIRQVMLAFPKLIDTEIVKRLRAIDIKVDRSLVSVVRHDDKKTAEEEKPTRPHRAGKRAYIGDTSAKKRRRRLKRRHKDVDFDLLEKAIDPAKTLVDMLGGEAAVKMVTMVASL